MSPSFVPSHTVAQHSCFTPDALAFPLQVLLQSVSTHHPAPRPRPAHPWHPIPDISFSDFEQSQTPSSLSMDELSKWRLSSITEWQSTCATVRNTNPGSPAGSCHCSATHICGPYFVVELRRLGWCGCRRSIQVRVNGHSERFVFLDDFEPFLIGDRDRPEDRFDVRFEDMLGDGDRSSELGTSSSLHYSSLMKDQFSSPFLQKQFSLVDLACLLSAIKHEHAEHRWTDGYADRSLIDFTISQMFVFLRYFFEGELSNQVREHRRTIAKLFYDRRIDIWNSVSWS